MTDTAPQARRSGDQQGLASVLLWIARRSSQFWDFIDQRDIDKHTVSVVIMLGTWKLTEWAMAYASMQHAKSGVEVAAIIAAVTAPYMALQAAALKFYFDARAP